MYRNLPYLPAAPDAILIHVPSLDVGHPLEQKAITNALWRIHVPHNYISHFKSGRKWDAVLHGPASFPSE